VCQTHYVPKVAQNKRRGRPQNGLSLCRPFFFLVLLDDSPWVLLVELEGVVEAAGVVDASDDDEDDEESDDAAG
jgi:hypothetical protein